jgi:magnesium chelatase family protein
MGLGRTFAVSLVGLAGHLVEVEAQVVASVPSFVLVGLPDTALSESRDRVRAAVTSCGISWPSRRITVSLSPASLPKSGSMFDLAVAVAILAGAGQINPKHCRNVVHLGELGLDGRLRPVRGILPAVARAVGAGMPSVVVPEANAAEARLVAGADVFGAVTLADVAHWHGGDVAPLTLPPAPALVTVGRSAPTADLADVIGQHEARRALEVAAAGGHHLLMVGPPGAGKTMLAARLPGILPDLADEESIEVTAIHSIAGTFDPSGGLVRRPPFEDPHHTATPAAIVGGGSGTIRPGAASRAHRGVLFLDEAPEFSARVLQTLRQPLESGEITIARAAGWFSFPARFQLVLAANPCPCGAGQGKMSSCTCSSLARRRYFGRLSGPLLDRVDLQVLVPPVPRAIALNGQPGESTAAVAARVAAARASQQERLVDTPWRLNSEVPGRWLRERLRPRRGLLTELDSALDRGALTLRGVDRVLRVAWTLADLAGANAPTRDHIGEGYVLRTRGIAA